MSAARVLGLVAVGLVLCQLPQGAAQPVTFTVLHGNDFHARVLGNSLHDTPCEMADEEGCMGGYARIKTVVDAERAKGQNLLVLDAGDQFSGSIWNSYYKGNASAAFMNAIGYDAMTLGNHEFDFDQQVLTDYLSSLQFPVLSSNLQIAPSSPLNMSRINKVTGGSGMNGWMVKDFGGGQPKVAIIGATTPDTAKLAPPMNVMGVTFKDVADSVSMAIDEIEAMYGVGGVDAFVALTHQGYVADKKLAEDVPKLDLIVGGHSHTFLHSEDMDCPRWGCKPCEEMGEGCMPECDFDDCMSSEGNYPTVVEHMTPPKSTYVVTAKAYSTYMGQIQLTCSAGACDIEMMETKLIPLFGPSADPDGLGIGAEVMMDMGILDMAMELTRPLSAYAMSVVGETMMMLNGDKKAVSTMETTYGNFLCDNLLDLAMGWNEEVRPDVCLTSGGGIAASLPAGPVTVGDVMSVHPFGNVLSVVKVSGATIWGLLEHGVSGVEMQSGRFAQIGGMVFAYDSSAPPMMRVSGVWTTGANGAYTKVANDDSMTYKVLTSNFLLEGGDGYMFHLDARDHMVLYETGPVIADAVKQIFEMNGPIMQNLDGRIWDCNGQYNAHVGPAAGDIGDICDIDIKYDDFFDDSEFCWFGCRREFVGDGVCHPMCMNLQCHFDEKDCMQFTGICSDDEFVSSSGACMDCSAAPMCPGHSMRMGCGHGEMGMCSDTVSLSLVSAVHLPSNPMGDKFEWDVGSGEQIAYDMDNMAVYVVGENMMMQVVNISDAAKPMIVETVQLPGPATDVAVCNGWVAVSVEGRYKTDNGTVIVYSTNKGMDMPTEMLYDIKTGPLPDMIKFVKNNGDCKYLLTANEAEGHLHFNMTGRNEVMFVNPEPSITALYWANGSVSMMPEEAMVSFKSLVEGNEEMLLMKGINWQFNPAVDADDMVYPMSERTLLKDLEPEYIALNHDNTRAFVCLQEANAMLILDITAFPPVPLSIEPLFVRDYWNDMVKMDVADKGHKIDMRVWPVIGKGMPDTIASFSMGADSYIAVANEGDVKEYTNGKLEDWLKMTMGMEMGKEEYEKKYLYEGDIRGEDLKMMDLEGMVHSDMEELMEWLGDEEELGRLKFDKGGCLNHTSGKHTMLCAQSSRSFSIFKVTPTDKLELVYDSGSMLEDLVAEHYPEIFNSDGPNVEDGLGRQMNYFDSRSDSKGPEVETLTIGVIDGRTLLFVGLERTSQIAVFDLADPMMPRFQSILSVAGQGELKAYWNEPHPGVGVVDPESMFVDEDRKLLVVSGAVSGVVAIFKINMPEDMPETCMYNEYKDGDECEECEDAPECPSMMRRSGCGYGVMGECTIHNITATPIGGLHLPDSYANAAELTGPKYKFDVGGAEQMAYDSESMMMYVVGENMILSVVDTTDPSHMKVVDVMELPHPATDIEVCDGWLAIGMEGSKKTDNGTVVMMKTYSGAPLKAMYNVSTGPLPGMIKFGKKCESLLTANEGEAVLYCSGQPCELDSCPGAAPYAADGACEFINPEPSVSLYQWPVNADGHGDLSQMPTTSHMGFAHLVDGKVAELRAKGVNFQFPFLANGDPAPILKFEGGGGGSAPFEALYPTTERTALKDLEPEYIALSTDGMYAYVCLQEANAIATVDIAAKKITKIDGLLRKDFMALGEHFDASDYMETSPGAAPCYSERKIMQDVFPVIGISAPDSIVVFEVDGVDYIAAAGEGGIKEYAEGVVGGGKEMVAELRGASFLDYIAGADLPVIDGYTPQQLEDELTGGDCGIGARQLGRLQFDKYGCWDADTEKLTGLCISGSRSVTIYKASDMSVVWDSGSMIEDQIAKMNPSIFNADTPVAGGKHEDQFDKSSANGGGPGVETLQFYDLDGQKLLFVGIEKTSHLFVWDVTNPLMPQLQSSLRLGTDDEIPASLGAVGAGSDMAMPDMGVFGPETMYMDKKRKILFIAGSDSGTIGAYAIGTPAAQTIGLPTIAQDLKTNYGMFAVSQAETWKSAISTLNKADMNMDGFLTAAEAKGLGLSDTLVDMFFAFSRSDWPFGEHYECDASRSSGITAGGIQRLLMFVELHIHGGQFAAMTLYDYEASLYSLAGSIHCAEEYMHHSKMMDEEHFFMYATETYFHLKDANMDMVLMGTEISHLPGLMKLKFPKGLDLYHFTDAVAAQWGSDHKESMACRGFTHLRASTMTEHFHVKPPLGGGECNLMFTAPGLFQEMKMPDMEPMPNLEKPSGVVQISYRGKPLCSGTLVTEEMVLTTASCAEMIKDEKMMAKVLVPLFDMEKYEDGESMMEVMIDDIYIHPGFMSDGRYNLALIELEKDVENMPMMITTVEAALGGVSDINKCGVDVDVVGYSYVYNFHVNRQMGKFHVMNGEQCSMSYAAYSGLHGIDALEGKGCGMSNLNMMMGPTRGLMQDKATLAECDDSASMAFLPGTPLIDTKHGAPQAIGMIEQDFGKDCFAPAVVQFLNADALTWILNKAMPEETESNNLKLSLTVKDPILPGKLEIGDTEVMTFPPEESDSCLLEDKMIMEASSKTLIMGELEAPMDYPAGVCMDSMCIKNYSVTFELKAMDSCPEIMMMAGCQNSSTTGCREMGMEKGCRWMHMMWMKPMCSIKPDWKLFQKLKHDKMAFKGGLGMSMAGGDYSFWMCWANWNPNEQKMCGVNAHEFGCFWYDKYSRTLDYAGSNSELQLVSEMEMM